MEAEVRSRAWRPLLSGTYAARAVDAVTEIGVALSTVDAPGNAWDADASLGRGKPGIALFFAGLSESTGDARHAETGRALVQAAVEDAGRSAIDHTFFGRTVGLGWALTALTGRLFEPDPDDESDVDDYVERLLALDPWPAHYDLATGLTGLGAYCLARFPRARADRCVELVVTRLSSLAVRQGDMATWFTTPAMAPARAEEFPDGHYDAGFAHGTAGVVAMLASAVDAGIGSARPLLEAATRWLAGWRLGQEHGSRYPARFAAGEPPATSRMAWCYGDPGVAVALLCAGRSLGSDDLVAEARTTARGCAGQHATARILDAGLCHGAAGAGHVLNRVGQALGDPEILDVARFWFERLLDGHQPGVPVAGFPRLDPSGTYVPAPGLIEGAAGVGLALLSAVATEPPWWDQAYLVAPERLLAADA